MCVKQTGWKLCQITAGDKKDIPNNEIRRNRFFFVKQTLFAFFSVGSAIIYFGHQEKTIEFC